MVANDLGQDTYGRTLAQLEVDGKDVNAAMVARDFEQIQASVGELLVDRPRRNILRRAQAAQGGGAL